LSASLAVEVVGEWLLVSLEVVAGAEESAVVLGGGPAVGVGLDVVDVAVLGGGVTAGPLAVPVV